MMSVDGIKPPKSKKLFTPSRSRQSNAVKPIPGVKRMAESTAAISHNNTITNIMVTGKSGAGKQPRIDALVEEFGVKCVPAIEYLRQTGIPVVSVPGNRKVFTKEHVRKSVLDAMTTLTQEG